MHSCGTVVVSSCFYLLLALVLITTRELTVSTKASDIVTSSPVYSGWGGGFAEISDLPSDKCPADACPQSVWDKYLLDCFLHF